MRRLALVSGVILLWSVGCAPCNAAGQPALAGTVTSDKEPQMEGVLISAKKVGGTITVTVVSDAQSYYAFPSGKLSPGKYQISIRAVGYDLDDPGEITVVANKTAHADLKLRPTNNLPAQLSNLEWVMSVPGTTEQKQLASCMVGCHSPMVPLSSRYNAQDFLTILKRMHSYAEASFYTPGVVAHQVKDAFDVPPNPKDPETAQYLASVNLRSSADGKWKFHLQTLPRLKGKSTKVIITEYDLPQRDFEPHDVAVDSDGMVWTADFGGPHLARLDPRTGEVKEWKVPNLKPDHPAYGLDVQFDKDGNPWFSMMDQGGLAMFDKRTQEIKTWSEPAEYDNEHAHVGMVAIGKDGLVWFKDSGNHMVFRLDPKTGHMDSYHMPSEEYGMRLDSHDNLYLASLQKGTIAEINGKTGEVTVWPTPTPDSGAHRGEMDGLDRFWFAESHPGQVGMFDTQTKQIKEWDLPFKPWGDPYEASPDKNGDTIWAGGEMTDYIYRLDPKTGQVTLYLLPRVQTNIRRVTVDNSTTPATVWIGENHQAKIAKLEFIE